MEDKRKIIGTLIGILGFIAAMAGLTYAMYTFTTTNNNTITGGHECINIKYTKGNDITANELNFVNDYTKGIYTDLVFYQQPNCGNNVGTIYIHTSATSAGTGLINGIGTGTEEHGVLKYTVEKNGTKIAEGYVTQQVACTSSPNGYDTVIEIGKLDETASSSPAANYRIYLWLETDSTGTITNETISEVTYSGYIHASARQTSTFIE